MTADELRKHICETYGLEVGQVYVDSVGYTPTWLVKLYNHSNAADAEICIAYFGGKYIVTSINKSSFLSGKEAIVIAKHMDIAGQILESGILEGIE